MIASMILKMSEQVKAIVGSRSLGNMCYLELKGVVNDQKKESKDKIKKAKLLNPAAAKQWFWPRCCDS